ncbi:nose resistant to fluoxetine protein 6 [Fopius arisanus]|uniref:Nose resistant to fluoxetine protein 6 n=2 Tax=Fopius arisanus TaxID=64838 RepID=A0A9R1TIX7_9HYME|nr:PREDICTED: nose resistant to fluoxetine protein 6-like [Fopius arisanus]
MKYNNLVFVLVPVAFLFVCLYASGDFIEENCKKNASDCIDQWVSKISHGINRESEFGKMDNDRVNTSRDLAADGENQVPLFLNLPLLPILFASSPTLPEGECKRHSLRYLRELKNGTLWASRMFDSSVKYPEGIIVGHTRHYGNFDECYELNAKISRQDPHLEPEEISGRYCLIKIKYRKINAPPSRPSPFTLNFDPNESAWEAVKEKGDFRRVKRYDLELALCVPSSCSAEDVDKALKIPLRRIGKEKQVFIETSIKGNTCQSKIDSPKFSTSAKVYCYIIGSLVAVVCLSTWYDNAMKHEKYRCDGGLATDLLLCFSARSNIRSIMDVSYSHPGLDSIHFIRFFFMCAVIFGHRYMQYYANPMINPEYLEHTYTVPSSILLYNGPIIVDGFLGVGGLLAAYYLLKELDTKRKINFSLSIIIRYIRLTPSYAAIIGFIALILPHLSTGPYWSHKIGLESEGCVENWWTNLLYINNYVKTDKMCMFQSWYVAVDYHLYIIALFAVYFFWKLPRRLGYPFLVAVIIAGCIISFCVSYMYSVQPMWLGLPFMHEVREDPYFTEHYVKTHERIAAYFVGVVAGAIIYDHGRSPWRLSQPWSSTLFMLVVLVLGVTSQNLGHKYYDPNVKVSALESALYSSLHRPAFAVSVVAIVILLTVGEGLDFHHSFFKGRWVQPLARLTYGAYLLHNINQCYDVGVIRQARTFSLHNCFWDFVPDVVLTFTLSLIVALVIEGPFRKIEKIFISRRISKKLSPSGFFTNIPPAQEKIA